MCVNMNKMTLVIKGSASQEILGYSWDQRRIKYVLDPEKVLQGNHEN